MLFFLIFRVADLIGRSRIAITVVLLISSSISFKAGAQTAVGVRTMAQTCLNCHATTNTNTIPVIAGRSKDELLSKLIAFKSEAPAPATTIMNRIAKGYSDEELAALADYFSKAHGGKN